MEPKTHEQKGCRMMQEGLATAAVVSQLFSCHFTVLAASTPLCCTSPGFAEGSMERREQLAV